MGHEVSYKKYDTNIDVQRTKAVQDIKEYVGEEYFNNLDGLLKQAIKQGDILNLDRFRMILFMFPVSGYPIKAWYETICLDLDMPAI